MSELEIAKDKFENGEELTTKEAIMIVLDSEIPENMSLEEL